MKVAAALLAAASMAVVAGGASAASVGPRTNYVLRCAGCHGFDGQSVSNLVPDLKGRAGYFLCNRASRDYIGRLPNIAFAEISDADMAALLNYIAFDIGSGSAPVQASGFDARELAPLRRAPLASTDLKSYRRKVVDGVIAECRAPKVLRTDYGGPSLR